MTAQLHTNACNLEPPRGQFPLGGSLWKLLLAFSTHSVLVSRPVLPWDGGVLGHPCQLHWVARQARSPGVPEAYHKSGPDILSHAIPYLPSLFLDNLFKHFLCDTAMREKLLYL